MSESSFCLKCKKTVDVKDSEIKLTKNNRKMMSAKCTICSTRTNKFLKKEASKIEELIKNDVKKEVKQDEKDEEVKEENKFPSLF